MTRTQDSVEAHHSELSAELSSSFATQVAVIGWREGFDYHADLALRQGSGLVSSSVHSEDPAAWSRENAALLALYEIEIASLLVTVAIEETDTPDLFAQASTRLRELIKIVRSARID